MSIKTIDGKLAGNKRKRSCKSKIINEFRIYLLIIDKSSAFKNKWNYLFHNTKKDKQINILRDNLTLKEIGQAYSRKSRAKHNISLKEASNYFENQQTAVHVLDFIFGANFYQLGL